MIILKILLWLYVALGGLYWLYQFFLIIRVIKSVPILTGVKQDASFEYPKLSVIITACNEADRIEPALKLRLQDDYPDLELIVVEDRSTDSTPEIIDRIAGNDPRVKVIHVTELPYGWLGKLNALNQGVKSATGEWLLFSDGDAFISPGTLKKAISYCGKKGLDHLAVIPELLPETFSYDIVCAILVRMICLVGKIWEIEDPKSKSSIGSGSFNLVRRTAFEKTKGFEWLKLEIVDDVCLGQMLKNSDVKCSVANGRGCVKVHFYRSLQELAIGSERSMFTGIGNFSMTRLIIVALFILLFEAFPFILLIPLGIPHLWIFGLAMIILSYASTIIINKWLNRPVLPVFFMPFGVIINVICTIRAGILGKIRGGIIWRGTFYPTELLKQGRRFRI